MSTVSALPPRVERLPARTVAATNDQRRARIATRVLLAAAALVFVDVMLSLLLGYSIPDGESAILSNVLIEYVRTGQWHYPVHAHELFYPGMKVFMLHPPLHYWLASWWVRLAGVGNWQLAAQSVMTATVVMLGIAVFCRRVYGRGTAALVLALAALFYGLHYSAVSLRCDVTFGACYTLFLFVLGRVWLLPLRGRSLTLHAACLGILSVACLAAHWNGYFVQTYLPFLAWKIACRERGHWKRNLSAVAGGMALAFVPWFLLFGEDLPGALVFAVLQGAQFMVLLNGGWTLFFAPLKEWPGGTTVVVGMVSILAEKLFRCGAALARRRPLRAELTATFADRCDLFLLTNLAAYLTWWSLFVHNRHPQYFGNFSFILLLLAARGYAVAISGILRRISVSVPLKECATAAFALLLALTSTQVMSALAWNPASLHDPQIVFDHTRAALRTVVPSDRQIIVGGNAYPYLYDSDYRSTMLLSATPFLKPIENVGFIETLRRHFAQRGSLDVYQLTPDQRRQLLVDFGDVLVTTESGHSWQNVYYSPDSWQRDYVEMATVFIHSPDVNGRMNSVHRAAWMRGPRFYTIYMRPELARRELQRLAAQVGRIQVDDCTAILVYDPFDKPRPRFTASEWTTCDDARKQREVRAYFDAQDWFGADFDDATKQSMLAQLMPEIERELATWSTYGRSLGQGVDVALLETGLIRAWSPKAP